METKSEQVEELMDEGWRFLISVFLDLDIQDTFLRLLLIFV